MLKLRSHAGGSWDRWRIRGISESYFVLVHNLIFSNLIYNCFLTYTKKNSLSQSIIEF